MSKWDFQTPATPSQRRIRRLTWIMAAIAVIEIAVFATILIKV